MSASKSGSGSGSTPLLPEEYDSLIERLRETAEDTIPRNATVLVVSRGDDELLRIGPRRAMHFPQDEFGRYPGYHPKDSRTAIDMLESMRVRGGEYLLLPSTAFWWLDYYEDFAAHLAGRYPAPTESDECMIFELTPTGVEAPSPDADTTEVLDATSTPRVAGPLDELLRALLPGDARIAVVTGGADALPSFPDADPVAEPAAAAGADFLVIPAASYDTGENGAPPAWRLVTNQRHLATVYERDATAAPSPATVSPQRSKPGLWQRITSLFRR